MAFTFQDICNAKANGTGRDVADLLGIQYPADSTVSESLFLMTTGNRIAREAAEQVAAGNGHGLYGAKRRASGNGKKAVDPLYAIADEEIVMAVRLASKKAGIGPTGDDARQAIESGNAVFIRFIDLNLSPEQRAVLEKAVGVLTPAEREAKRRSDLIANIRMAVLKAMRLDGMRKELEAAGFLVEAPAWFADVSGIDLPNIETHSIGELEAIAATVH